MIAATMVIQRFWRRYKSIYNKYLARRSRRVQLIRKPRSQTRSSQGNSRHSGAPYRTVIGTVPGEEVPTVSATMKLLEEQLTTLSKRWLTPKADLGVA